jgi:fructose-1,6-bisphosphatase/inositol monophosphatase family enzyme
VKWDADTQWVLPVPGLQQPIKLSGEVRIKGQEPVRISLAPRSEQGKKPSPRPSKADLAGHEFGFYWRSLRQGDSRPNLKLMADGRVLVSDAGSEASWDIEGGLLVLRAADGRPTAVYHKFTQLRDAWTAFGPCLERRGTENILTQK